MKKTKTPTQDSYESILQAYDFFNQALFSGKLPKVIITYHRQRRVMGYASIARWVNAKREFVDELAVNPEYFAQYPLIEICQTLCHEMVHIWQAHFGKPGRRGYHNAEWARKMKSIGLMPSSTSKPGGSETGENMMDYILVDGPFLKTCQKLINKGFKIPWVDRYPTFRQEVPILAFSPEDEPIELNKNCQPKKKLATAELKHRSDNEIISFSFEDVPSGHEINGEVLNHSEQSSEFQSTFTTKPAQKSGRVKYCCKSCQILVWGKRNLRISCLDCNLQLQEVT
ncbi:SprT family zinc-dependent metalloprotease [Aliikangiella marina]|uniref:SprT family zinc-dependent metalloprotease n=1 Tax=Aliikangiella marina TaxID=1712262 RepID=A0A545TJB1_9GAMM|nr:SprT-like domain-containing protein [Aliikangiella marina]TQV77324.1 SprT family zinc-dependent metalloprotease [Aliikangiella marina]